MATGSAEKVKKLSEYSPEELKGELKSAADSGDFAKVQEISKLLLDMGNAKNAEVKFNEAQIKILKKISKEKADTGEVKQFVENDLKNRKSETSSKIKHIEEFKDKKIEELEKQLAGKDEEIDKYKAVLTTLPSALDIISPQTRKFSRVGRAIQEMKEKKESPKNILIYCMAVTQTQIFGTRSKVKRGRIKMMKKRKSASIVENEDIKKTKASLAPDKDSKSKYRELLKELILKEINNQQEEYYKQMKTQVTG